MPVIATEKKFLELETDLTRQARNFSKWKRVALIADNQTNGSKKAEKNFQTAHAVHVLNNMWNYKAETEQPDFSDKAFAQMLVSIEIASPEGQRDALNVLIPLLDEILDNPDGEDIEFYKSMFDKLGSRLDVSNQALVLEWVFENCMTYIDDMEIVRFSNEDINQNDYSRGYADEAKASLGDKIFRESVMEDGYPLSTEVAAWVTTLLPQNHPRYIGEITLPVNGGDCPTGFWIAPDPSGEETILAVDEEDPFVTKSLPDMVDEFRRSVRGQTPESKKRKAVERTVSDLASLFTSKVEAREDSPSLQMALLRSVTQLRTCDIAD